MIEAKGGEMQRCALNASLLFAKAVLRDSFSWGISGTGKTPQGVKRSETDEEAYRQPPGKRPPEAQINWPTFSDKTLSLNEHLIKQSSARI
ncbi:hypothetical protein [Sporosarcina highlanderae]|uniref:hypothetical protein n=1 Tax=Sporosarcina highlanderae TaxID=3035916 RepID=UPI00263AD2AC|nr:hypothetical protein [Sporosarcina highlanderae]